MKNAYDLASLFDAALHTLEGNRDELNRSDPLNANHGDHMVEIFHIASQSARGDPAANLADAMDSAALQLRQLPDNGTAQVYAHGLGQFAQQFRQRQVSLEDLLGYVQRTVQTEATDETTSPSARSGEVIKALLNGLAAWQAAESESDQPGGPLNMSVLFEMGIAYMQAKQRGGTRLEVIADAAASVSPLSRVPYRYASGKLALTALLQAMAAA